MLNAFGPGCQKAQGIKPKMSGSSRKSTHDVRKHKEIGSADRKLKQILMYRSSMQLNIMLRCSRNLTNDVRKLKETMMP
jgi:hypothetical protein